MPSELLRFRCHHCGKRLKVTPDRAGERLGCPQCGGAVVVPASADEHHTTEVSLFSGAVADDDRFEVRSAPPAEDEGPDMTPMVDVVFQLLIFFMVTAAFTQQMSLQIPPPEQKDKQQKSVQQLQDDQSVVVIRVDSDNTIWVDDAEVLSDHDLLAKLRDSVEGDDGQRATTLIVLASGEARHDNVVKALDAGNAVGVESVQLALNESED